MATNIQTWGGSGQALSPREKKRRENMLAAYSEASYEQGLQAANEVIGSQLGSMVAHNSMMNIDMLGDVVVSVADNPIKAGPMMQVFKAYCIGEVNRVARFSNRW